MLSIESEYNYLQLLASAHHHGWDIQQGPYVTFEKVIDENHLTRIHVAYDDNFEVVEAFLFMLDGSAMGTVDLSANQVHQALAS